MYILTVSVYIILIQADSFNILLIETRTTHSMSVTSESMSSSSASSTSCSFVRRCGSLMRVCESDATFCSLDSKITFLRTRLPWARTALSTFGCANLILRLLCIHPRCSTYARMRRHSSSPNTISSRTMPGCQTKPVPFHPDILHERFHPALLRPFHISLCEGSFGLVMLLFIMQIILFRTDCLLPSKRLRIGLLLVLCHPSPMKQAPISL